jgi:hypothetical protein
MYHLNYVAYLRCYFNLSRFRAADRLEINLCLLVASCAVIYNCVVDSTSSSVTLG